MAKRILGLLGFLLGVIGVLLCLAVIVGAWWVNRPITDSLLQLFPPVEAALAFGDNMADSFSDFLGDTQDQFNTVADAKPVATQLEDEIEQIGIYVDIASGVVNGVEASVAGVEASAQAVDGLRGNGVARAAGQLGDRLGELDARLNSVGSLATDVREGRDGRIDDLNAQVDRLEGESAEFQSTIAQTQTEIDELKRKIPRWIDLGSLIVSLIFLWFGIAQYLLLKRGWQMMRQLT